MDIARHIGFPFSISTDFSVVLLRRARHLSEEKLSNIHTRTEDDRDGVHIREFECDIEIVTGVDQSCSIVHDESESSKRWLPWELDEVFLTSEFLYTCAEDCDSWAEDESIFVGDDDLFVFRKHFIHRVDIAYRVILHDEKSITETDIVARGLESRLIEIGDRDISRSYRSADVTVRKIHRAIV